VRVCKRPFGCSVLIVEVCTYKPDVHASIRRRLSIRQHLFSMWQYSVLIAILTSMRQRLVRQYRGLHFLRLDRSRTLLRSQAYTQSRSAPSSGAIERVTWLLRLPIPSVPHRSRPQSQCCLLPCKLLHKGQRRPNPIPNVSVGENEVILVKVPSCPVPRRASLAARHSRTPSEKLGATVRCIEPCVIPSVSLY